MKRVRRKRAGLFRMAICGVLALLTALETGGVLAKSGSLGNVTQNWPAAAVYYDSPCPNTETFRMTEEEFLQKKTGLETRLVLAYSRLYHALDGSKKTALKQSQKDWIACYYAYLEALDQTWNGPVKIFYGVQGKERRTNIYRDFAIGMLTDRIDDLTCWYDGRLARLAPAAAEEASAELKTALKTLQVDMGLCLYVTDEAYREKITAAHRTFYAYYASDQALVSLLSGKSEDAVTAEGHVKVQRMSYLTHVHYQGCRFFHREREE